MLAQVTSTSKTHLSTADSYLYTIIAIGSIVVICLASLAGIGLIIYRFRCRQRNFGYLNISGVDLSDMNYSQTVPLANPNSSEQTANQ